MRRLIGAAATAVVAVLLLGAPAAAGPAGAGCPPGWELAPVSILGEDFTGVADNVNHDGMICVRDLRNGAAVFIDNTVP